MFCTQYHAHTCSFVCRPQTPRCSIPLHTAQPTACHNRKKRLASVCLLLQLAKPLLNSLDWSTKLTSWCQVSDIWIANSISVSDLRRVIKNISGVISEGRSPLSRQRLTSFLKFHSWTSWAKTTIATTCLIRVSTIDHEKAIFVLY